MTPGLQLKILQLLRLAKQQGHLTFANIEATLPDSVDSHGEINFVLAALQALEIEVIEPDQAARLVPPPAGSPPGAIDFLDPVQAYLNQISSLRPLSNARETALFKRAEKAETRAEAIAVTLPTIGRYFVEVGTKLLVDKEHLPRVVKHSKLKSAALYLKSLPVLIDAVRRQETRMLKSWEEHRRAPTTKKRKLIRVSLRRRQSALRSSLLRFRFKLKFFEEYLAQLQPVLDEITPLFDRIAPQSPAKLKNSARAETAATKERLSEIENEQRISPALLVATTRKIAEQVIKAHAAKTKLVTAHFRQVISIAKKYVNRGLSFLDLIHEGNMGLMKAIDGFDYREGQDFTAFAGPWIRQSIIRALARNHAP